MFILSALLIFPACGLLCTTWSDVYIQRKFMKIQGQKIYCHIFKIYCHILSHETNIVTTITNLKLLLQNLPHSEFSFSYFY